MPTSPKESLALDTNLLLDLAGEKDFAHEFREEFSGIGYSLLVPPTVVAELAFFTSQTDIAEQELASIALANVDRWKCQPFTLSATQLAIAKQFATRLPAWRCAGPIDPGSKVTRPEFKRDQYEGLISFCIPHSSF
jgi:hypothetical protein